MSIDSLEIWADITAIRKNAPLIHNITNYVVMNTTANALLALGASPVMAHAEPEVEQMVNIAGAVVINIGTLSDSWIRSMFLACTRAHKNKIPIAGEIAAKTAAGPGTLQSGFIDALYNLSKKEIVHYFKE